MIRTRCHPLDTGGVAFQNGVHNHGYTNTPPENGTIRSARVGHLKIWWNWSLLGWCQNISHRSIKPCVKIPNLLIYIWKKCIGQRSTWLAKVVVPLMRRTAPSLTAGKGPQSTNLHTGGSAVHCPPSWHVMTFSPTNEWPRSQANVAVSLVLRPLIDITPLSKSGNSGQRPSNPSFTMKLVNLNVSTSSQHCRKNPNSFKWTVVWGISAEPNWKWFKSWGREIWTETSQETVGIGIE